MERSLTEKKMNNFEKIIHDTIAEYQEKIEHHPIMNILMNGRVTSGLYVAYLRETYHMVRHTTRMLSLAAARLEDDRRGLRDWFIEEASEENGHDLFCIKDIKAMGYDPQEVLAVPPSPGSWSLVTQNYFMATYGNPAGILGVASLTEQLGATLATTMANVLTEKYSLSSNCTTFLRSHGGFDAKHIEDVKKAINTLIDDKTDFSDVLQGRRMTIYYYSRMFSDVMETPVEIRDIAV